MASVWPRLMMEATSSGCSLVNMFPTHSSSWWPIVEDIFSSPVVTALTRRLLDESVLHDEFCFLSVDGTVKCILPTMGQNKYSADAKERKQGDCFPSSETIWRVITVRGATGVVVALLPSPSEKASFVAERLGQSLPPRLPLQSERLELVAQVRDFVSKVRPAKSKTILKRPEARNPAKLKRRTPFNLNRTQGIRRQGVAKRRPVLLQRSTRKRRAQGVCRKENVLKQLLCAVCTRRCTHTYILTYIHTYVHM